MLGQFYSLSLLPQFVAAFDLLNPHKLPLSWKGHIQLSYNEWLKNKDLSYRTFLIKSILQQQKTTPKRIFKSGQTTLQKKAWSC